MDTEARGRLLMDHVMGQGDFKSAVIDFLNVESENVVRNLEAFKYEILSQLNNGTFFCVCPENPWATPSSGENRVKGVRKPTLLGFSPFYYYPFLFHTAFPPLPMEFLRALSYGNRILMEGIILVDDRMDADITISPIDLFLVDACYQKALEILVPFLPPKDPFWNKCETLFLEYCHAVLQELMSHRYRLQPYSSEQFYTIAVGKAGLIKTTVLALTAFSGDTEHCDKIVESQEAFLAGFQAFDDLKDWREDLARQNYTCLLTGVLQEGGFVPHIESGIFPDPEEVGRHLYYSGKAEAQLNLAEKLFHRSMDLVEGLCLPLWQEMVRGFLNNASAMRLDLEEIRRRECLRAEQGKARTRAAKDGEDRPMILLSKIMASGVRFLLQKQEPQGSFSLISSPYTYMNPNTPRGPSRAVTALILQSIEPMQSVQPELLPAMRKASTWLRNDAMPDSPTFPMDLEQSFQTFTAEQLLQYDGEFQKILQGTNSSDGFIPFEGFFWVNILYQAALQDLALPSVENYALKSIQTADYSSWIYGFDPQGKTGSVIRPLMLLYFISKTLALRPHSPLWAGKDAFQNRLLPRYQTGGTWGNYTETALALTGLLSLGYCGPELQSAVERIVQGQEPDGSWPPNAFCSKEELCYGSRDLTTALCLEALNIYRQEHLNIPQQGETWLGKKDEALPSVTPHPDVPPEILQTVRSVIEQCRDILPNPAPIQFYVGQWISMSGHFLLRDTKDTAIGINLDPGIVPCRSASRRPLSTEVTLAFVEAVRMQTQGVTFKPLESVFLGGIGLLLCQKLWPDQPIWEQSGMYLLDWQWCSDNEWYLYEVLKQRMYYKPREDEPDSSFLHPPLIIYPPAPHNGELYLGMRLLDQQRKTKVTHELIRELMSWSLSDIHRQFQKVCGLKHKKMSSIL